MSQLKIEPKCIGTTHADFYNKPIPLSEEFKLKNEKQYDDNIFLSIKKRLKKEKNVPPGILLRSHDFSTKYQVEHFFLFLIFF